MTPVAHKKSLQGPCASSKSEHPVNPKAERKEWSHKRSSPLTGRSKVSPATVHNIEAVFKMVREIYGRERDDPMNDLEVNMTMLGIFLNATLRAAIHLGHDYEAKLRYGKNHLRNSEGQLLRETAKKLISDRK